MSPPPAFDPDRLRVYTGGDLALETQLLEVFRAQTHEGLSQMAAAVASADGVCWRQVAHKLKSSSAVMGALALAEHFQAAEAEETPDPDRMAARLDVLRAEFGAVCRLAEQHLGVARP